MPRRSKRSINHCVGADIRFYIQIIEEEDRKRREANAEEDLGEEVVVPEEDIFSDEEIQDEDSTEEEIPFPDLKILLYIHHFYFH